MSKPRTDTPDCCRREIIERVCEGDAPRESLVEAILDRFEQRPDHVSSQEEERRR